MKFPRLFSFVLLAFTLGTAAPAQENAEFTALRAKAVRGNGIAQYNLGLAYMEGHGTAADPLEAYVWLTLARENGARGRALDSLIGSLDKASFEAAQQKLIAYKAAAGLKAPATPAPRVEPAPAKPATTTVAEAPKTAPAAPGPKPATADREALATKLSELTAEVASLRADRQRLAQQAADNEKSAEAATAASRILQEQARASVTRLAELAHDAETAKVELARAKQSLATLAQAPKPAPDTAALDAKTRELQTALAELEISRKFGRQVDETLNKITDRKTALESQLAAALGQAKATAESALAAKPAVPAYPDLSGKVTALEAAAADSSRRLAERDNQTQQLAQESKRLERTLNQAQESYTALQAEADKLRAKSSAPVYPDLRTNVAALETQLATLSAEAGNAKQVITSLTKAKEEAQKNLATKPMAPAYPDLSGKVKALENQVTVLTTEAGRSKQEIAALTQTAAETQQTLAATRLAKPAYPDLSEKVRELASQASTLGATAAAATKELTDARTQVAALTQAKAEATQKLAAGAAEHAALQSELARLRAQGTAPKYPDLSGRVAELQAKLASTEKALAEKPSAPAYPDLAGQVKELEQALGDTNRQLIAAQNVKPAAPAYPDLSGKVAELEAAGTKAREQAAQKIASTEQARAELSKQFDAYKSTTATAQRESTSLQASLKMLESDKVALHRQTEAATSEAVQLRTQVAALKTAAAAIKPVVPAYPDLSGKVAELETGVAALNKAKEETTAQSARVAAERDSLSSEAARTKQEMSALTQAMEAARAGQNELRDTVAKLAQEKAGLVAAVAATQKAASAYPDLSGRVHELESALATTTARVSELTLTADEHAKLAASLQNELKQAQATLAAKPAVPSYPDLSGRVSELESKLASTEKNLAEKSPAPAYPNLSDKVTELEATIANLTGEIAQAKQARAELAKQFDAYKSATVASQRESTTLQASVKMLESDKVALRRQAETATTEAGQLRTQVAALKTATAAIKPAAPAYPDLSDKVNALENQIAVLTAKPAAPTYPDLSGRVRELEAKLAATDKPAAPAYPDLRGQVAELQAQLAAKPAAPAYADLSGKVAELESVLTESSRKLAAADAAQAQLQSQLAGAQGKRDDSTQSRRERDELSGRVTSLAGEVAQLRIDRERMQKMLADAGKQLRDGTADATRIKDLEAQAAVAGPQAETANAQIAQFKTALTAKPAGPSYPDLSDKVNALENQIAVLTTEAGRAKQEAAVKGGSIPAYPDLSARVHELETTLTDTKRQLAAAQTTAAPVAAADPSDLQKKLADTEDRLATSLRGYAALERERDTLAASASKSADSVNAENAALAARLAAGESRVAAAQAEATRATETLNALQRSSAQASNDLAATRALAQQLQGSNTVLASENYQLKTMLARSVGTPASVTTAPVAASPVLAARTHVIASGDSLSRISQRYYGNANRWPDIYNVNRDKIGADGVLRVGAELRIP